MAGTTRVTEQSLLGEGHRALEEGDWQRASDAFRAALGLCESPAGYEGLATALEALEDGPGAMSSRERAYLAFRESGEAAGAARMAIFLALDVLDFQGKLAVMRGWLERARHLLEETPPSFEHAFLAGVEAHVAMFRGHDPERTQVLAVHARSIAHAAGDIDAEMLAMALEGLARVTRGDVASGMALLDESSAAATAGELHNRAFVAQLLCYVIAACERVQDFDRAGQWCERLAELSERWALRSMLAACRTQYAGVLMARGTWVEAERELQVATLDLRRTRPGMAGDGLVRLAELRRRQGRIAEAAQLCREADRAPFRAQARPAVFMVLAELALDGGDPTGAADIVERYLRAIPAEDRTGRAAGLELLVRTRVLDGPDAVRDPMQELVAISQLVETTPLQASERYVRGILAHAHGDHDDARRAFEDAVDLYGAASMPYEEARARTALAAVLRSSGRVDRAEQEARAARDAFRALGVTAASAAIHSWLPSTDAPVLAEPAGLSPREQDVLRLIAQGLSNRQIAERLFLSVRTVERHISNIYAKLGASGKAARAQATSYAHRHALV
jgi:DNA-binding NarL/FixJ family response regulator